MNDGTTNRETADRNIKRFAAALKEGRGNPAVIRRKIDDWLEYRHRAKKDGSLNDETRL